MSKFSIPLLTTEARVIMPNETTIVDFNFEKLDEFDLNNFKINHRQFACHPDLGILTAPIGSKNVYQSFRNPTPIEGLHHYGEALVFRIPEKFETKPLQCKTAHIEVLGDNGEIVCWCNEGYKSSGSGNGD
jgi:hypothetical protein